MLMFSIITTLLAPAADTTGEFEVPQGDVVFVTQALDEAIYVLKSSDASPDEKQRAVVKATRIANDRLARQSFVAERLGTITNENAESVIREVVEMLSFVPVHEAELPDGAPTFTPVGMIELKQYQKVRKAVAGGFFTLFTHIRKNNIAMTTPVQMDYEMSDAGRLKQKNMAFFYGATTMGKTGRDGRVEVVEDEPITVVATGVRGRRNDNVIRDRITRLHNWIEETEEFEVSGPIRLMGYNSPFVPASKQFYEVQIPIRKIVSDDNTSP